MKASVVSQEGSKAGQVFAAPMACVNV